MTKEKLKELLDSATPQEREVLDRIATGYRKGAATLRRIAVDTGVWDFDSEKFVDDGLIALNGEGGWYIQSSLSEYHELREQAAFA